MKPPKGGRLSRQKDVKLKPGRKPLPPGEFTAEAKAIRADIALHAAALAAAGDWPSYSAVAKAAGLTDAVVKSHRDALEDARNDYERLHGESAYRPKAPATTGAVGERAVDNPDDCPADVVPEGGDADADATDFGNGAPAAATTSQTHSTIEASLRKEAQRNDRLVREKGEDKAAIAELKRQLLERDEIVRRLMLPKRSPLSRYTLDDAEFR